MEIKIEEVWCRIKRPNGWWREIPQTRLVFTRRDGSRFVRGMTQAEYSLSADNSYEYRSPAEKDRKL